MSDTNDAPARDRHDEDVPYLAPTPEAIEERILRSPVHRALGLRVHSVDRAELRLTAEATPEWFNTTGRDVVHGGLVATVLDTVTAHAVVPHTGATGPTIDLTVHYLRPVPQGTLQLVGRAVRVGRSVNVVDGEVWAPDVDLDGDRTGLEPLAVARGTFVSRWATAPEE